MITVKLHGAIRDLMPKGKKQSIKLYANSVMEVLDGLEQFAPVKQFINDHPHEIRVGTSLKHSVSLTADHAANWTLKHGTTLHILPHASGHEITTAMIVSAIISTVVGIGISFLMSLFVPKPEDTKDTRKSALFSGGLNNVQEGVPLSYLAGKKVLAGMNIIEAFVERQSTGGTTSYGTGDPAYSAPFGGGVGGGSAEPVYGDVFDGGGGTKYNKLGEAIFEAAKGGGKTLQNNQFSQATGKALGALGAGPIGGIYGDDDATKEQHIYLNEMALRGGSGQRSYNGITWTERSGVAGQSVVGITPGVQNQFSVSIPMQKLNLSGEQNYYPEVVTTYDVDAVRVAFRVSSLVKTDKNGNQSSTSVTVGVRVRRQGDSWTEALQQTFTGKATTPFERDFIVNAPAVDGTKKWEFSVYRVTDDSSDDKLQNSINFVGWTEIQYEDYAYDGSTGEPPTALLGISVDMAQFDQGENFPEVAAEVVGRLVRVPTNYNPETRVYTGSWDGSYKLAATENPVWHWLELATDPLMGAGYPDSFFSKFALYDIAKWCDEDVNGRPRYTLNKQFTDDREGWEFLTELAKSFGCLCYFTGQYFVLVADRPKSTADHYVTNSQVKDGRFRYDSVELTERINTYDVEWDNPGDFYRVAVATYSDDDAVAACASRGITNNGVVRQRVYKIGCTNEQEAYDYARLLTFQAQREYKTVTFTTTLIGAGYAPGQLIDVDDWWLSGKDPVGRIVDIPTSGTVTLDAPVTFSASTPYNLHVVTNTGSIIRPIVQFLSETTTDTVQVDTTGLTGWEAAGIVEPGGVQPQRYRIIDIQEDEAGEYKVVGRLHIAGKYGWVEENVPAPNIMWTKQSVVTPTPTGLAAHQFAMRDDMGGVVRSLEITWDAINDNQYALGGYMLEAYRPGVGAWEVIYQGNDTFFTIRNVQPGNYVLSVKSLNTFGKASPPSAPVTFHYATGAYDASLAAPTFIGFD